MELVSISWLWTWSGIWHGGMMMMMNVEARYGREINHKEQRNWSNSTTKSMIIDEKWENLDKNQDQRSKT